jgi:hypothetical protein
MSRRVVAGLSALIAAGAAAGPAQACDETSHVQAAHVHGARRDAPLVIGDSTAIISAPLLGRFGIEADAHGCRQFDEGIGIIARRPRHLLPDAVVLALGANGPVSRTQIGHARRVLGDRRFLLLVTPRNMASSARAMRAADRAHPDRVLALDWARFSAGHPRWFAGDGLHVDRTGADAYARFIRDGLAPFLAASRRGLRLDLPAQAGAGHDEPCGTVRAHGRAIDVSLTRGAGRLSCAYARKLMAGPRLHPPRRWRYYDWRTVGRGPWTDVLARRDRSVVVAGIER